MSTEPGAYQEIMSYIELNPMAVLGTVNDDGTPYGAVIYVCVVSNKIVCFVTKNFTKKYLNLSKRPIVSLTIGNERESSTLQATGNASVVEDPQLLDYAMEKMRKAHANRAEWLPPIEKLNAGNYVVVAIELQSARLGKFNGLGIGSADIFTEI